MIRKFIAAFALIFFTTTTVAFAADEIDWEKAEEIYGSIVKFDPITRTLRATGLGYGGINNETFQKSYYWGYSFQIARMDALFNLAEVLGGITTEEKIESDKKIKTYRMSQDSEVFKFLKQNARETERKYYEDGTGEVAMEVIVPDGWVIKRGN